MSGNCNQHRCGVAAPTCVLNESKYAMESAVAITESHIYSVTDLLHSIAFQAGGCNHVESRNWIVELNEDWGSEDASDQSMVQGVLDSFNDLYLCLLRGLGELGCD